MASTTERAFPALAPAVPSELRASILQIPLFGDEHFLFQGVNLHPSIVATLQLSGRLWSDADRTVKQFSGSALLPVTATTVSTPLILERGALLSCRLSVDTAGIRFGNVWARLLLTKGRTGAITVPMTLLQGYPTNFQDLAWPGSPIQDLHASKGAIRGVTWTQDTGVDISVTVPALRRWRVLAGLMELSTAAPVAGRTLFLSVASAGTVPFGSESTPPLPAVSVQIYALAPGMVPLAAAPGNRTLLPFPVDLELFAGDRIEIVTNNAQLGDSLVGFGLQVREWFDPI